MSNERLYNEEEIAEIFGTAADAQERAQTQLMRAEGLTLVELQEIGSEVGITPEFISRASVAVGGRAEATQETARFLGLPISATHTVELPGELSEADWDRLVLDLRSTFRAPGRVHRSGSLREWSNGNLHAIVEPTETGHRLHLNTFKGNARGVVVGGLAVFAFFLMLVIKAIFDGYAVDSQMMFVGLLSAMGLGTAAVSAIRLPGWARERKNQMEAIAERASERAATKNAAMTAETSRGADSSSSLAQAVVLERPEFEDLDNSEQARGPRERTR